MERPARDATVPVPVVLAGAGEPALARLSAALSQNPIADLYAAALKAREHLCWDCGAELDAETQRTGYCEECAPDHPET